MADRPHTPPHWIAQAQLYMDEEIITPWVHPCPACGSVDDVSFCLGDYWCRCGHEWTD